MLRLDIGGNDVVPWFLKPGEYTVRHGQDGQPVAWVVTPNGHGPARLEGWDLTEHEDGTITVSPSILAHPPTGHDRSRGVRVLEYSSAWHGYLERGVWREV
jgi:hypothetical protein